MDFVELIFVIAKFIHSKVYFNEVFEFAPKGNISLRNNFLKLKRPFQNTKTR